MLVVVVGCGISGLTSALRLCEAGYSVSMVAAEPPERTTSATAAALWYPYRAFPEQEVTRWAGATYTALATLSRQRKTGVRLRSGRALFTAPTPEPFWRSAVPVLDRVPPSALPPGYADGFVLSVPVVDPSIHLPWLRQRAIELGVDFRWGSVTDLAEVAPEASVIVNCTGLGSTDLLGDDTLIAVRGQVVVVEQVGLTEWTVDDTDPAAPTYVVPRGRSIVLGGTAEVGETDVEPDAATAAAIRDRCVALVPKLAGARVLAHHVGLRPARPSVRLGADRLGTGQSVVHNYGHGGSGWTLSYGCAADVVDLVTSAT